MSQNKAAAQTTAAGKVVRSVSGAELSGQSDKDKIPGSMRSINNEKAEAGDQSGKASRQGMAGNQSGRVSWSMSWLKVRR